MSRCICALLVFLPLSLFSQPYTGYVFDADTNDPIVGAIIYPFFQDQQTKITGNDGAFSLEMDPATLSTNSYYQLRVYKPGYESGLFPIRFPILEPILLRKSSNGFIHIKNSDGDFIDGIEIRHQLGRPTKSDRFGYAEMIVPPGMDEKQVFSISVRGGKFYKDKSINITIEELKRSVISLILEKKEVTYQGLIDQFEDELDKYTKSLEKHHPDRAKQHLDNSFRVYEDLRTFQHLSPREHEDKKMRMRHYKKLLNWLYGIDLNQDDVEKLEGDYKEADKKFRKAYRHFVDTPPIIEDAVPEIETLLQHAFICLNLSVLRYRLHPPGRDLVEHNLNNVLNLLEYLAHLQNEFAKAGLDTTIIEQLDFLIHKHNDALEMIILNLDK